MTELPEIPGAQELLAKVIAETYEKRQALLETFMLGYLLENPGYKVSDLTLVEDTTEPLKIKWYLAPKDSIK